MWDCGNSSEFMKKHRKILERDYNSQFEDYPDIIQEDRMKYNNDKLSKLRTSEKLQPLNWKMVMMNSEISSL